MILVLNGLSRPWILVLAWEGKRKAGSACPQRIYVHSSSPERRNFWSIVFPYLWSAQDVLLSICNISRYTVQYSSKSCPVGSATNNLITPRVLSSISRPTLPAMKSSSMEPHRTLTKCSTPSGCLVHMPVKFVEYSWIILWAIFYTKTTTSYQTIAAFNAKSKNEYMNSNYEIINC